MTQEGSWGLPVPGAAAGDGGGGGAAPPPRDETLLALRSRAAGGETRKMVEMIPGCCRFGSSRNKSAGRLHRSGSALA